MGRVAAQSRRNSGLRLQFSLSSTRGLPKSGMGYTRRRKSLPSWQSVSDEIESLVLEFYFVFAYCLFFKIQFEWGIHYYNCAGIFEVDLCVVKNKWIFLIKTIVRKEEMLGHSSNWPVGEWILLLSIVFRIMVNTLCEGWTLSF